MWILDLREVPIPRLVGDNYLTRKIREFYGKNVTHH